MVEQFLSGARERKKSIVVFSTWAYPHPYLNVDPDMNLDAEKCAVIAQ